MTNIASVLKAEIARVARKEIRSEIEGLKKASAQQRATIAQLRRELAELQKALKEGRRLAAAQARAAGKASPSVASAAPAAVEDDGTPRRFSATRLEAHRKKLGLSAADYGTLVGISGATIYNWEQGKTRPSPEQVQALGLVKLMSPTAVKARVAELANAGEPTAAG